MVRFFCDRFMLKSVVPLVEGYLTGNTTMTSIMPVNDSSKNGSEQQIGIIFLLHRNYPILSRNATKLYQHAMCFGGCMTEQVVSIVMQPSEDGNSKNNSR